MKIGIVTVYNGYNFGAYMQAYALSEYLTTQGHDVSFVKHHARNPYLNMVKNVATQTLSLKFADNSYCIKSYKGLKKARKNLKYTSLKDAENLDLVIYGSDEIWNIKRKRNYKAPLFFGELINKPRKISYAPSLNGAEEKDFAPFPNFVEKMQAFEGLSTRDEQSREVLEKVLKREVEIVVDPTMLLPVENYRKIEKEVSFGGKYILIYSYGKNFSETIIEGIKSFASNNGLKLVSVCCPLKWCDISIGLSPFEVLYAFDKAEYVIADTFHGLMFSMIFKKSFAIPSITSSKLKESVDLYGHYDRVLSEGKTFDDIFGTPMDYDRIDSVINSVRQRSTEFLNKAGEEK